jgi:hypothetical protein
MTNTYPTYQPGDVALDANDGSIWSIDTVTAHTSGFLDAHTILWATHLATGYRTALLDTDLVPVIA